MELPSDEELIDEDYNSAAEDMDVDDEASDEESEESSKKTKDKKRK
jgi:hypothetical protein